MDRKVKCRCSVAIIFELQNESAIKTAIATEISPKVGELCDVGDVIDGVSFGVELEDQTVGAEVVVIDRVEGEVEDDPLM